MTVRSPIFCRSPKVDRKKSGFSDLKWRSVAPIFPESQDSTRKMHLKMLKLESLLVKIYQNSPKSPKSGKSPLPEEDYTNRVSGLSSRDQVFFNFSENFKKIAQSSSIFWPGLVAGPKSWPTSSDQMKNFIKIEDFDFILPIEIQDFHFPPRHW